MPQVSLEGLEFYAYHGHFDEEQKLGNKYSIDVVVDFQEAQATHTDRLQDTLDYVEIYKSVEAVMRLKYRMLEKIGQSIIDRITEKFSFIEYIEVNVSKFNPPIGGICHKAKVKVFKKIK
ncbi:MAG: dihydroneopterin aldolase [Leadbetterella sp.]